MEFCVFTPTDLRNVLVRWGRSCSTCSLFRRAKAIPNDHNDSCTSHSTIPLTLPQHQPTSLICALPVVWIVKIATGTSAARNDFTLVDVSTILAWLRAVARFFIAHPVVFRTTCAKITIAANNHLTMRHISTIMILRHAKPLLLSKYLCLVVNRRLVVNRATDETKQNRAGNYTDLEVLTSAAAGNLVLVPKENITFTYRLVRGWFGRHDGKLISHYNTFQAFKYVLHLINWEQRDLKEGTNTLHQIICSNQIFWSVDNLRISQ